MIRVELFVLTRARRKVFAAYTGMKTADELDVSLDLDLAAAGSRSDLSRRLRTSYRGFGL